MVYTTLETYMDGEYQADLPDILFSVDRIECMMYQGENYQGTFDIQGSEEISGFITVSAPRMSCSHKSFQGKKNTISYTFNSRGMSKGDVVKGTFDIICNAGEYSLPFVATIEKFHFQSTMGSIKNLFHFTNLAQNSWNEALKLFENKKFPEIFSKHDRQFIPLYEGLLKNHNHNYAMEEFLIAIRKKEPIAFSLGKPREKFSDVAFDLRDCVPLIKKNWGYFEVEVSSDAAFLLPSKRYLHEEDFVGSLCPFSYDIKYELLHEGKNMARLTFHIGKESLTFPVVAQKQKRKEKKPQDKGLYADLITYYIEFRTRRLASQEWVKKSKERIHNAPLHCQKTNNILLYQVQLLLAEKKREDAIYILKTAIDPKQLRKSDSEAYCYYLYLLALIEQKESARDKALHAVREQLKIGGGNWHTLWLLLYLEESYEMDHRKKYEDIKSFCERGCYHPVIYMEVINLLKRDSALLSRLDDFELRILNWAVNTGQFTRELAARTINLAQSYSSFSPVFYRILGKCYEVYPDKEVIFTICSILIRNDKQEEKYFKWYQSAIDYELKITRLYEYYLMSMNTKVYVPLPRSVLMYFMFQCDLNAQKKAYLYVNLMKHQEEYPELYQKYLEQIYDFARGELEKRHIDENLAYIYQQVLEREHLEESQVEALSAIMFTYRIFIQEKNVQRIVIRHNTLYLEESFACNQGEAYVNLYNESYCLLGEDEYGNRFPVTLKETPVRLYQDASMEEFCFQKGKTEIGIYIHRLMDKGACLVVDDTNVQKLRALTKSLVVKPEEKREFYGKIADYYYEQEDYEELDNYLLEVELEELPAQDRVRLIEYMIIRKMYEKSYQYVSTYGAEGINQKFLLRICSLYLQEQREDYQEDEKFCRLCHYLYGRGKYDTQLLNYLVHYYQGSIGQMRNLWKSSKELEIDNYDLEERLLVQSLFAHSYVEELIDIFEDYIRQGARPSIEKAFVVNQSYEYFVKQKITDKRVLERLYHMFAEGEELPDICKVSVLRYYAELPEYHQEYEQVLEKLLQELMEQGIVFEFFKKYDYPVGELLLLQDKSMLEIFCGEETQLYINYIYEHQEGEYATEPMETPFPGVASKGFILFFGEALQYYLMKEEKGEQEILSSGRLVAMEQPISHGESRYELINDMLISKEMQDEKTLELLMDKYIKTDYLTEKVFTIK